jgi:hypothetical protein
MTLWIGYKAISQIVVVTRAELNIKLPTLYPFDRPQVESKRHTNRLADTGLTPS